INEVEILLERSAEFYPGDLPSYHPARLTGGPLAHYRAARVFTNPQEAFLQLNPLEQSLEVSRCHAEALLVQERLGELILTLNERQALTQRAIGVLPFSEACRLVEIFECAATRPRNIAQSGQSLVAAIRMIEPEFGQGTALAYCAFVVAGLRAKQEFINYGTKLDTLFERIISAPSVLETLDRAVASPGGVKFDLLLRVLVAVRDRLWELKPSRCGGDSFLLPRVLDGYLSNRHTCGSGLGLAMLDAVIVGKLGFPVRFLAPGHTLEILVEGHSVYWDATKPTQLSFIPPETQGRLELSQIISLNYSALAAGYFGRELWDRAIENYHRALELTPDSAETWTNLGVCYLRKEMPQKALEVLEHALRLETNSAETHHALGNCYAMMHQWPRAIAAYRKAVQLRPHYVEALYNMGLAFQNAGQPDQARAAFEAIIEIRPTVTAAHLALGNLNLELGAIDEAIRCYKEVVRLEPSLVSAHYNLGQAYYKKGRLDDAIHAYQRALELNPKHPGAWHNLGIAYRDKGQTEKAVAALEKAISLNPNLMK
ncbi:MAG: tetratricopeptide repeat protein, partial [candidate division WOR-3 bacterium]